MTTGETLIEKKDFLFLHFETKKEGGYYET